MNKVRGNDARIPLGAWYPGSTKALHPTAQRLSIRVIHARLALSLEALGTLLVLQGLDEILHIAV